MTTIVGDAGRCVLVADTLYNDGQTKWYDDKVHRIARPEGEALFAGAGSFADIHLVVQFLRGLGPQPTLVNENSFLLLTHAGLLSAGDALVWEPVNTVMAIGTGAHAAEAMLRQGYTAEEAVRSAIDVDLFSGGKAKAYRLRKRR